MRTSSTAMDGMVDKPMLVGMLLKNPILWTVIAVNAVFGAVLDHVEGLAASWKVLFGALAFFGSLLAQLLNYWIKARQQRDKAVEDNAARLERLLNEEREDHQKEVERYLKRIADLERRFDKSK